MSSRDDERKKKKKKQEDWLMAQITAMMEKALKEAWRQVENDLFKDWK